MTAFDYVLLAILAASIVISLLRGLVKEVLSLAAWLAAFVIANRYGADLAALLPESIPAGTVRLVAAFVILFVGTLLLASLLNLAIAHIIDASGLRVVDRGLGGLFGLARGLLIVLTLVILAGLTDLPKQPVWRDALLVDVTESAVRLVKPWLPDDWARHVNY
ncbi:MAG: CvpA family protein [Burkholderiaceae bacterium]